MSRLRLIITVLTGLCTLVLLPIATNVATSDLPEWLQPHTRLAWPALLVLAVITVGLLISDVNSDRPADDS